MGTKIKWALALLSVVVLLIGTFFLFGNRVSLTTEEKTYSPGCYFVQCYLKNTTFRSVYYGDTFYLQKQQNGEWVEYELNVNFELPLYRCAPLSTEHVSIPVHLYSNLMHKGDYRIRLPYWTGMPTGPEAETQMVYAVFTVE